MRLASPRPVLGVRTSLAASLFAIAASSCSSEPPAAAAKETPRRPSTACAAGDSTRPIQAFDINPDPSSGKTCDVGGVLDEDGKVTILGWPGGAPHTLADREVTGCVAAEFGDGVTLDSLSMTMRPVGSGCGHACSASGKDGCGTGWKVSIFAGPSLDALDWVQQLSLTRAEPFEYRIVIYEAFQARFVAVCREPTPTTGDDVAIEALSGTCK